MTKLIRLVCLCSGVVGLLALAVWSGQYAGSQVHDQHGLVGVFHHDFGIVENNGGPIRLEHEFKLTNRSNRRIEVLNAISSCGCGIADVSPPIVKPGEELSVKVSYRFDAPATRREEVYLHLDSGDRVTITVSGTSRRTHLYYSTRDSIVLEPDSVKHIVIVASNYDTNDEPGPPFFRHPDNVAVAFEGWKLVFPIDLDSGRPSYWQGTVKCSTDATWSPSLGEQIQIDFGLGGRTQVIDLTGRPWTRRFAD